MLDTEHIEVRVNLNDGFSKLVDALRRKAHVVVFNSLGSRTNLTVYYGDDEAHQLDQGRFPQGVSFTNIVKKCRVVQREGDEFAIIPICLPSVPIDLSDWPLDDEDRRILGESVCQSEYARFYGVALIGSLFPLLWALRDLYALDPRAFTISLPTHHGGSRVESEYTLDHLKVMYPTLDIGRLISRIAGVDREARSGGADRRRIRMQPTKTPYVANADLHRDAIRLLQLIAYTLDIRRAIDGDGYANDAAEDERTGLTTGEIFDLGNRFHWHPAHISALFDILIDDGTLITRVERCKTPTSSFQLTRTFRPDGEVVSDLIRRYTVQWGLPDV